MKGALTLESITSTKLQKVAARAREYPDGQIYALAHLLDEECLKRAFHRLKVNAAVGIDEVTVKEYGANLNDNIKDLLSRMKEMRYRHKPIKRTHIRKPGGGTRPLGISSTEDKVVQGALKEVLEVVFEPTFMDSSYGYRPGRKAHDVVKRLNREGFSGKVNWILEADIKAFFDSVDRKMLLDMIQCRVQDGKIRRLVGKCLNVGILEGTVLSREDTGTAQGSILSPLLANIYLHYVLDKWFDEEVVPRMNGRVILLRFCDDFIITFEFRNDADKVMAVLGKRLEKYGLQLHPDKTKLIPFRRPDPDQKGGKGPGTFEFLGFKLFWKRSRKGTWRLAVETSSASLSRFIKKLNILCRSQRHGTISEQAKALYKRIIGHYNYFAVNGNGKCINAIREAVSRNWFRALKSRSQKSRYTWAKFKRMLKDFPFPKTYVRVQIW